MDDTVAKMYGNKVRVRACGLCRNEGKLLLVNHSGLGEANLWAPPGGGVDFGMTIEETLRNEFLEETGLEVAVGSFAFGAEFIKPPLHAIELFYEVTLIGGSLSTGVDPELNIITQVAFLSGQDILSLPPGELHGIFKYYPTSDGLRGLKGFYRL